MMLNFYETCMYIRDVIYGDTEDALKKAFPHCQIEFKDTERGFMFIVVDKEGEFVPENEIILALEKACKESLKNKTSDTAWRSLETSIRQMRYVVDGQQRDKEMQEGRPAELK